MFGLYIFPWLMIAATLLFFPPDWPLRTLQRLDRRRPALTTASGDRPPGSATIRPVSAVMTALFAVWVVVQLVVPLRHFAIEGRPSWTEEGHRFAWHMMLRDKSGSARFHLTDGDRTWIVDPADHLTAA
ncbi:MAG: hypothetical protein ACSLE8_19885, partial [Rhodococcus sp. (in: high G+C Gram-positive bacteria)]